MYKITYYYLSNISDLCQQWMNGTSQLFKRGENMNVLYILIPLLKRYSSNLEVESLAQRPTNWAAAQISLWVITVLCGDPSGPDRWAPWLIFAVEDMTSVLYRPTAFNISCSSLTMTSFSTVFFMVQFSCLNTDLIHCLHSFFIS